MKTWNRKFVNKNFTNALFKKRFKPKWNRYNNKTAQNQYQRQYNLNCSITQEKYNNTDKGIELNPIGSLRTSPVKSTARTDNDISLVITEQYNLWKTKNIFTVPEHLLYVSYGKFAFRSIGNEQEEHTIGI